MELSSSKAKIVLGHDFFSCSKEENKKKESLPTITFHRYPMPIMNNLHEPLLSPSPSSSPASAIHSHSQNSYSLNTQLLNDNLFSFFEKVDSISFSTEALRQAFHVLQQEQFKQSPKNSLALGSKMQAHMDSIVSQARSIKLSLDSLDQDNINNRLLPGCHENSSVDRVRVFVTNGMRRKLKGFMDDFSALQKKVRDDHRDDVRRRVFALTGQIASEEVVDEMIEAGETENFLREAIKEQGGQVKLEATVHQIEERNASVRHLEESLLALHQIFLDMAVLVDVQGEELNDIERNMLESMSFIKIGAEDLDGAVIADTQRRTTHTWVIIVSIICLLLLIGVTLTVVFLVLRQ
ncbi:hypothetical protein L7F22_050007 [Adiantum nelumboides]|nr:hypothetical protein [Adiantum nelumboides]